jgi:hypothetical protein
MPNGDMSPPKTDPRQFAQIKNNDPGAKTSSIFKKMGKAKQQNFTQDPTPNDTPSLPLRKDIPKFETQH